MTSKLAAGLLCLSVFSTTIGGGMAAKAESLTDALIGAYRHSGLLEQNRATLRAADEDVAQAVATLRPVIDYVASYTYSTSFSSGIDASSGSVGLSLSQLIYNFGLSQLNIDIAKESVLATREGLISVEQDVLFNAINAYVSVRSNLAAVDLRQNNLRLIDEQLRAARDRFEVGEITRTDVAFAEARLAEALSGLASAQGNLEQSREAYRQAVGRYPGNLEPLPALPATADSLEAARNVARRTHPNIRRAMRQVTIAELAIAASEARMRPQITLNGSVSVNNDLENSSSIGLRLSGPIYQGGALSSQVRQAQAQRDGARGSLHAARHLIEQNVGNAWALIAVARASLAATDEQIRAATVAFRGAQEEATVGARTMLDVLNAEQDLLDARVGRIAAETNRILAVYSLLQAMGLLTVDHLNLGIVTYDPAAYYNAVRDAPTRFVSPQGEKLDRVLKSLGRN